MKKKIFLGLFAIVLCVLLVGCTEKKKEEEKKTDDKVGGWALYVDAEKISIPNEAEAAFTEAVKEYKDMTLEPIALIATQTVSGTNYMFFCRGTKDKVIDFEIAIIYKDLEGVSKVTKVTKFDLEKYVSKEIEFKKENVVGGWEVNANIEEWKVDGDALNAFEAVTKELTGVMYSPVAILGTQVVSGTNYALLTYNTITNETHDTYVGVMTIYKDLQGNYKLTSVAYVDLAEFNK